jgi:hypothetical protein
MIITALLRYFTPQTGNIVQIPELLGILVSTVLIFNLLQKIISRKHSWNIVIACMTVVLLSLNYITLE